MSTRGRSPASQVAAAGQALASASTAARSSASAPAAPLSASPAPPAAALCVSLHDVAPATWPACERVLAAVAAVAPLRLALLVVPRYRGVDSGRDRLFVRALERRLALGDELVLHGYTHVDEAPAGYRALDLLRRRVYTAGEGEFAALDRAQAQWRLYAGLDWFAARGWPVHGFVAPAWLMSAGTLAALAGTPLRYAATRRRLLLRPAAPPAASVFAPSLCWSTRAGWRRAASLLWNEALLVANARRPLLRLALHPADADHPAVRASWQHALREALQARPARTEGELVADLLAAAERGPAEADANGAELGGLAGQALHH